MAAALRGPGGRFRWRPRAAAGGTRGAAGTAAGGARRGPTRRGLHACPHGQSPGGRGRAGAGAGQCPRVLPEPPTGTHRAGPGPATAARGGGAGAATGPPARAWGAPACSAVPGTLRSRPRSLALDKDPAPGGHVLRPPSRDARGLFPEMVTAGEGPRLARSGWSRPRPRRPRRPSRVLPRRGEPGKGAERRPEGGFADPGTLAGAPGLSVLAAGVRGAVGEDQCSCAVGPSAHLSQGKDVERGAAGHITWALWQSRAALGCSWAIPKILPPQSSGSQGKEAPDESLLSCRGGGLAGRGTGPAPREEAQSSSIPAQLSRKVPAPSQPWGWPTQ